MQKSARFWIHNQEFLSTEGICLLGQRQAATPLVGAWLARIVKLSDRKQLSRTGYDATEENSASFRTIGGKTHRLPFGWRRTLPNRCELWFLVVVSCHSQKISAQ